jgi:hypothetical protein
MYQDVTSIKPLYLSEEEAMAILDLCLTSDVEMDDVKERAMRKVIDLARTYLSVDEEAQPATSSQPLVAEHCGQRGEAEQDEEPVCALHRASAQQPVTPLTMMYRSVGRAHSSLRRMGAALAVRRTLHQHPTSTAS